MISPNNLYRQMLQYAKARTNFYRAKTFRRQMYWHNQFANISKRIEYCSITINESM